jgi:alpha-1,2-mannosyltransferase
MFLASSLIVGARLVGSLTNSVHDCDEVYNYWEPLHYLVHGSGMQTWEYRCANQLLLLRTDSWRIN